MVGSRGQGLDSLKVIDLGSHLPQICNEGQGGKGKREHWTKIEGHKLVASGPWAYFWLTENFKNFHT